MLNNTNYNLMMQIVEEHKSLWRMEQNYQDDASNDEACKEFWGRMITDKKEHIEELTQLIKDRL